MKKVLLVCCMLIGISAVSFAQGGQRRSPADQAKMMQTSLKLTDDQTAKITTILTAQSVSRDSVMKASGDDRQAAMQAFRPMMKANNEKIMAILTPDQKAAWEKMQAERRAQGGGQGGGRTAPPAPQK
jgi:protein CpxP